MKNLKIEMIHDVVCSWCPIGYANIKQAINNLNINADIYFLPFELNPDMEAAGEEINEHLGKRYDWSEEKRTNYRQHLLAVAQEAGVEMDFSKRTHYYNSQKAHKLIHWSEGFNKQVAMNEALIDGYFKQGLDINDIDVLLQLVEELRLDREQAKQALSSAELISSFDRKRKRVQSIGMTSVPAFILNDQTLVTGSNSVAYFEQALLAVSRQ